MNSNLNNAKRNKNDEFYTLYDDIERELMHYKEHLKGKKIFCNADDYKKSNFTKFFVDNFHCLGIKQIESLDINGNYYKYDGENVVTKLLSNGDFRSEASIELLKEADIVCTNPPFSLFREYVAQLVEYDKQFLIIGNFNAVKYKEIFPLIKDERLWVGYSPRSMTFIQPDGSEKQVNAVWFTNLEVKRRKEPMKLYHSYEGNEDKYPKYDNYDAIEVSRVNSIPKDYEGVMGVPITFLTKHIPMQFEILGVTDRQNTSGLRTKKYTKDDNSKFNDLNASSVILKNGEYISKYTRILIKNKNPEIKEDIED